MKWVCYNLLFLLIYPFLLPGFILRMLRRGGYAARMGDRFALYPASLRARFAQERGALVWIHAVSVGEVQVAGQLMREWRKVEPEVRFCFSTTSSTGWKMAEREITERDVLIYNPLDFPTFVKAALLMVSPRAIVLTESEIWPNFIRTARKLGLPIFLINARVSDRSAPRYRAARFFFRDVFRSFVRIFAQSDLDKARLVAAGAPAERTEVTGSFKFDVARRNEVKELELRAWLEANGCSRDARILLGGSTWPGEDRILLEIYSKLPKDVVLVLAPRHFEKADEVEANIRAAGFACVRRSRPTPIDSRNSSRPPVFLSDTTGELMGLYALASVVFIGKSLCAHGSQNMIEPCLCGKITLVGPYTENFRPVMSDLIAANAIVQVANAAELETKIVAAFNGGFAELGAKAASAVERRRGVVAKCLAEIRRLIPALLLILAFAGCYKEGNQEVRKTCDAVKLVVRGIYRVESSVRSLRRPLFVPIDVDGISADELKKQLSVFTNAASTHVWMPGEKSWVIVEHLPDSRVELDLAMEALAEDSSCTLSVPEIFASYVGTLEEILPAFESKLEGEVVPEWFVPKEVPAIGWVSIKDVDDDILKAMMPEIRSMQLSRRLVLEGMMASRQAKDLKAEEAVTEKWAQAFKCNPTDSLLLERLDVLEKNARGFLEVGKVLQAMKCYETMIVVNPKDAVAVHNFGMCLKKLGRLDMAEKVLSRAKELANPH